MATRHFRTWVAVALGFLTMVTVSMAPANEPINWQRARELLRREQQGQTLTPEEQAYRNRAKQQRRLQAQAAGQVPTPRETTGLVPLTDMGDGLYKEQAGGLVWTREDLGSDGTHPSPIGRQKVANLLLTFFKTDANAKQWFVKPKS
jgi:lysophospholipase L1-like esterase